MKVIYSPPLLFFSSSRAAKICARVLARVRVFGACANGHSLVVRSGGVILEIPMEFRLKGWRKRPWTILDTHTHTEKEREREAHTHGNVEYIEILSV